MRKRDWWGGGVVAVLLALLAMCGWCEEMTGGYYSIEISAITAGGGIAAGGGGADTLWGAAAQPLAQAKLTGDSYNLFSGVYTPLIPEAAGVAVLGVAGALAVRRRSN